MAALQTLRNKPALLMSVIGGALLLFIVTLTDLNSCSRPNVEAEVNGKELTYEDFEQQVSSEENLETLLTGGITDSRKDEIRQATWTRFLQAQIIDKEADKLGVVATKEDIQNALSSVTPQQLQQIAQMMQSGQGSLNNITYAQKIMLLMANYMGQPSVEAYKQFMKSVDQQIAQFQKQDPQSAEMLSNLKQACLYCESRIPDEVRINKYMGLLAQGAISNPVSAKMTFEDNSTTLNVDIASIPYSSVADKDIKITDADLKAKYEECKELFRINNETRDLKLIDVTVTASAKDQTKIFNDVKALEDTLRKASTPEAVENIMRGASKNALSYNNVYVPKETYTQSNLNDIVAAIDSLSVGAVSKTRVEARDQNGIQYIATYKIVGVKTTPDSMQICQFAVDTKTMAEQVIAAVKGGSTLSAEAKKHDDLVKKYGLKGDTTWNATKYYVEDKVAKGDTASSTYTDICQIPTGTTAYYTVSNQQTGQPIYVITSVLSTKSPSAKYNVAAVKYPITFSNETKSEKRRALDEFLAKNKTLDAIEKNAPKAGYTLIDRPNFSTSDAMDVRYSIGGEGAKQAFIWAFDDAKAGNVSQVFECGKESEQLLVVAVAGINDGSYRKWDCPSVKAQLETLVMIDKKADKILSAVKNIKNFAAAKAVKGADVTSQPALPLGQIINYEPTLAGAIERTKKGQFTGAVKGVSSVYMVQVNDKTLTGTYNDQMARMTAARMTLSHIFGQQNSIFDALLNSAKITDKRYKF